MQGGGDPALLLHLDRRHRAHTARVLQSEAGVRALDRDVRCALVEPARDAVPRADGGLPANVLPRSTCAADPEVVQVPADRNRRGGGPNGRGRGEGTGGAAAGYRRGGGADGWGGRGDLARGSRGRGGECERVSDGGGRGGGEG